MYSIEELREELQQAIEAGDPDWIKIVSEELAEAEEAEEDSFDIPDDIDEVGFNPYMGEYDYDC